MSPKCQREGVCVPSCALTKKTSIRGMPKKTGFTVVSSSSHEDNFSAKELMVHAPTVNGWRSSRRLFPAVELRQRQREQWERAEQQETGQTEHPTRPDRRSGWLGRFWSHKRRTNDE
ncbi:uncharacterized protein LOC110368767 isoform X3 [Fundulus heteroclitus]|uniref:uncharacterized protein LOC110368767 isoform X3 n=1 Tax=Fundulus heteroclitus TaxID=8078 RepID=UPI00165C7CB1|nr:uncharacterized protein LOC110368767 isoform X3 [Fundulus heteroclitus]